jgi:tetratricopeptide (TPR) repeat protein/cellulose biosynthesis protein BcsQ
MNTLGKVITFYSYKGGVGRSMGLANVAALLAKWRMKVLVVDWDLEAPGIEAYFNNTQPSLAEQRKNKPGVIDLVWAVGDDQRVDWRECLLTTQPFPEGEKLKLLLAGMDDGEYISRVQHTNWDRLFETKGLGLYIEELRDAWKSEYDFILVDSRTGITDIGGVCTIHLPDYLLAWFTTTKTSMAGVKDVADRSRSGREELPFDRNPLLVLPVPARDERHTEVKLFGEWKDRIVKEFGGFYMEWLPKEATPLDVVEKLRIPHVPYWSFGERLAVVEEGTDDVNSIGGAYDLLSRLIFFHFEWRDVERDPEHSIEYLSRAVTADPLRFGPEYAELLFKEASDSEKQRIEADESEKQRIETDVVEMLRKAIEVWGQLANNNLVSYGPKLARAHTFLSDYLKSMREPDVPASISEATEAVNVYRKLYEIDRVNFGEELASSLTEFSRKLYESEDTERATEALREVINTQRTLAEANPRRFEADFAEGLFNLSNYLIALNLFTDAATAANEAVIVYRRLVTVNKERYEPDLATSLNTLTECLLDVGDVENALVTGQEAVEIFKRLASEDPRRHEPDLASSLNSLLDLISQLGPNDAARAASFVREAVDRFRNLARQDPKRYEPDLAKSLNLLTELLTEKDDSSDGEIQEALRAQEEAIEIFRRLGHDSPSLYEPELARSLTTLSRIRSRVNDMTGARVAAEEALQIFERLGARRYREEINELSELLKM